MWREERIVDTRRNFWDRERQVKKEDLVGRTRVERKLRGERRRSVAMNLPVVFPLFLLCFLSIVAYIGKRGTVGKNVQDIKDHSSLLSSNFSFSSLLLLCCFLIFPFFLSIGVQTFWGNWAWMLKQPVWFQASLLMPLLLPSFVCTVERICACACEILCPSDHAHPWKVTESANYLCC